MKQSPQWSKKKDYGDIEGKEVKFQRKGSR